MARSFTWIGPAGATFDGPGDWEDVTSGTPEATTADPGAVDTAIFRRPALGLTGPGTAGTIEIAAATSLTAGALQFGNLVVAGATLTIGAGATLHFEPALRTANQAALIVGGVAGMLAVGGVGANVTVSGGPGETDDLQVLSGDTVSLTQGGSCTADVLDLAGTGAIAVVDGGGSLHTTTQLAAGWLALGDGATAEAIWRNQATGVLGLLTVGFGELFGRGVGTLLVQTGASITDSGYAAIGYGGSDAGSVTLDGTGTGFGSAGLFVGNGGIGTLTIENAAILRTGVEGGDVTSFAGAVANLPGSSGSVLVNGAGSTWTIAGRYDFGLGGFATLNVLGGGVVRSTVGPVAIVDNGVTSWDASLSLVSATVLVEGAGSTFSASYGPIWVGNQGTASLTISSGGTVSAAAPAIGVAGLSLGLGGGSGTLLVTGAGSALSLRGLFAVGVDGGASVTIAAGGRVAVNGDMQLGGTSAGQRLVTLNAGSLAVSGDLMCGAGTLAIGAGGLVTFGHAATLAADTLVTLSGGAVEIGGASHVRSGAVVIDAGADLSGAGRVQAVVINSGSITALAGAALMLTELQGTGELSIVENALVEIGTLDSGTMDFAGAGTLRLDVPPETPQSVRLAIGLDGGTIDLLDEHATGTSFSGGDLVVDIADSVPLLFGLAGQPPLGAPSVVPDGSGGSDIVLPCFARGTRIRTRRGEIAVEHLRAGDFAVTAGGQGRAVVWVGSRTLACRRHARPQDVMPVRVVAGAFAPGVPARDVLLSPDHALLCGGALIPVRYLLNGRTIVQEDVGRITYFHVELESHDVLLAENLPAESFLDTGNRGAFSGAGVLTLHPNFARAVWQARGCAALVLGGPPVERARKKLLRRAARLGHGTTDDADLRLFADGARLPALIAGKRVRAWLPPNAKSLRLVSRSWIPAHAGARETDTRRLGIAIGPLWLDGRLASLDSPGLSAGWWAPEPGWRWTEGDAALQVAGIREVAFDVAMTGTYWMSLPSRRLARER